MPRGGSRQKVFNTHRNSLEHAALANTPKFKCTHPPQLSVQEEGWHCSSTGRALYELLEGCRLGPQWQQVVFLPS